MSLFIQILELLRYLPAVIAFLHETVVEFEKLKTIEEKKDFPPIVKTLRGRPSVIVGSSDLGSVKDTAMNVVNSMVDSDDFKRIERGE